MAAADGRAHRRHHKTRCTYRAHASHCVPPLAALNTALRMLKRSCGPIPRLCWSEVNAESTRWMGTLPWMDRNPRARMDPVARQMAALALANLCTARAAVRLIDRCAACAAGMAIASPPVLMGTVAQRSALPRLSIPSHPNRADRADRASPTRRDLPALPRANRSTTLARRRRAADGS